MIRNLWPIGLYSFMFSFVKLSSLIIYCIILLYQYILLFCVLLVTFAYVSIESIDCNLQSSLPLNAVVLTFSVNTLYFLLLILYCDFDINLLFFRNSLLFSLRLSRSIFFVLVCLFHFRVDLPLNIGYDLQI